MTTKSIIGIAIVIIIIVLIVVWLWKTPKTPAAPVTPPPTTSSTTMPSTTPVSPNPTPTPAPAPTATPIATNVTMIQGMKVETVKEGSGPAITAGQTAEMLYTGKLTDGTVFDSTASRNNQPFAFTLGAGQVIKGWDLGVAGMKVGEERILTIPPDLAYGAGGVPPVIPANATLIFDVTLVGIK